MLNIAVWNAMWKKKNQLYMYEHNVILAAVFARGSLVCRLNCTVRGKPEWPRVLIFTNVNRGSFFRESSKLLAVA